MSSVIPEGLEEFIRNEAKALEYELVDLSCKGSRGILLEVVIDKKGGVTLDECSAFNKKICLWLDTTNAVGAPYTVDVCSPGLDRNLKTKNDFLWACGKNVVIKTYVPVDGKSEIVGKLVKVDNETQVEVEPACGGVIPIRKGNISKANLQMLANREKK